MIDTDHEENRARTVFRTILRRETRHRRQHHAALLLTFVSAFATMATGGEGLIGFWSAMMTGVGGLLQAGLGMTANQTSNLAVRAKALNLSVARAAADGADDALTELQTDRLSLEAEAGHIPS